MFDIEYRGGNTVVLSTKKIEVVVDPKRSVVGKKDIISKDGVELATEKRFMTNGAAYRVSLEGPGEYEISDVQIKGVPAYRHLDDPTTSSKDTTIYSIVIDGIHIAVLGNISPKLTDEQLEEIGVIDVLIVPVGGNGYTLDATSAVAITAEVNPKIVIPVHYADSSLAYEVPQNNVDEFIEKIKAPVAEESKLKIKSEQSLPVSLEIHKLTLVN